MIASGVLDVDDGAVCGTRPRIPRNSLNPIRWKGKEGKNDGVDGLYPFYVEVKSRHKMTASMSAACCFCRGRNEGEPERVVLNISKVIERLAFSSLQDLEQKSTSLC